MRMFSGTKIGRLPTGKVLLGSNKLAKVFSNVRCSFSIQVRCKPLEFRQLELIDEWLINFHLFFEHKEFISLLASAALAANSGLSVRSIILDSTMLVFGDSSLIWEPKLAMPLATCLGDKFF